jgi:hypothetical protein
MLRTLPAIASLLVLAGPTFLQAALETSEGSTGQQPRRDYATLNVCEAVPGDVVARALGGKLAEVRHFSDKAFSRCTYFIVPSGSDKRLGYVVWMQPATDFEELKKSTAETITVVPGLGDAAYFFQDKGDGRFKINVLKRGDLMFQATANTAESARKIADAVAAHVWRKAS